MSGLSPVGPFPPSERIRKRREFRAVQNTGRRVTTAHFVLLLSARESEAEGRPRLGIVASRKVGTAVVRNRAKRLVREAFRTVRDLFAPGIDLVVIVRKPLEKELKRDDVAQEWRAVAHVVRRRTADARADLAPDVARSSGAYERR